MKILYSFILILLSLCAIAQDNNMLAKVAFEDAETAYAAGKAFEASKELQKVDSLLGKITPKSQYLRVQDWRLAAEQNPSNIEGAIQNCKLYLDLAKSFDIPEEKQMEVTRLSQKLEKAKVDWEQKNKRDEETYARMAKYMDSLYRVYKYKPGLTGEEFLQYNPEAIKGLKRTNYSTPKDFQYENKYYPKTGTSKRVHISNGIVTLYNYAIKAGGKSVIDEIEDEYAKIKSTIETIFPKNFYKHNKKQSYTYLSEDCVIYYKTESTLHHVRFTMHKNDFGSNRYNLLEVDFMGSVVK